MKLLYVLLLAVAACSSPVPDSSRSAPNLAHNAPVAVQPSEGRFSGEWYQRDAAQPCHNALRISHDTLGRYNINFVPCDTLYSIDAYAAYATGDSLHVFGVPEHHAPEMWLHLEAGRQRLIIRYQPVDFRNRPQPTVVRGTFWLDPAQARRRN